MKYISGLTFALFAFLISCGDANPVKVEYEGLKFELPIRVDKAKSILGLHYEYYSGFCKGEVNDKSIETQLENYPVFGGSDNDKEESYWKQYIVGVTFFKKDSTLEQIKEIFERSYNQKFKVGQMDLGKRRTLPPFTMTYYYLKTDQGVFIALKEIERNLNQKKYISVSFYKGISESELGKYLEFIN